MKTHYFSSIVALFGSLAAANAAILTVTTTSNTPIAGQTNLTQAIQLLHDGDTIQFNIPGSGVHYLDTPTDGYPLITANSVTIDGYSQPGAAPNTNPIHAPNNAQLKIVLTSTNGNGLSMETAVTNFTGHAYKHLGFGPDELAILGFFRGTNCTVKGLAFQSAPQVTGSTFTGDMKTISFCADSLEVGGAGGNAGGWHVSGCWFGIDPATRKVAYLPDGVTVATPAICIASYRTRNDDGSNPVYPQPGTIGVAAGSTNPRAEFNVFVTGYGFDSEGLNYRVSGNFFNVLPDGVTSADMSVLNGGSQLGDGFIEIGRDYSNCLIGTDGDGVNDADEGNVFGGFANGGAVMIDLYSSSAGTNFVIAGNWFGIGVDGVTRFTNAAPMVHSFNGSAAVRFGSDFDGVSDAWEANRVYGFTNISDIFFDGNGGALNPGLRLSFRGNVTVNNEIVPFSYANGTGSRLAGFTNYEAGFMSTNASVIPILTNSVYPRLIGTCATGTPPYTNIIIDVYQLDPEGWDNGKLAGLQELVNPDGTTNGFAQGRKYLGSFVDNGPLDSDPAVGRFNLDLSGLDLGPGPVTVTANYSADPPKTHNGRVHTSNFSTPVTVLPGGVSSVGVTHIVPDMLLWYNQNGNYYTNGPIDTGAQLANLGNWEPYISVVGDSTFLIGANTFADNQTPPVVTSQSGPFQRFVVTLQPAAGGPPKIGEEFFGDDGTPYRGVINLSRENGNPQRVAGDKRFGAVNFITGAETSAGQLPAFQSDSRWTSNAIFSAENRYTTEQTFSLDPASLLQTPLHKAIDATHGRYTATFGGNTPEVARFGGELAGLDNGNFVVVVDDRADYLSPAGTRTATAVIVTPAGAIVKETYPVTATTNAINNQIWSNVAAYQGGFCVRFNATLFFYDDAGNLQGSSPQSSSGLAFDGGRGDGTRIASDIRSHYVYLAGAAPNTAHAPVMLAIWDARTQAFVTAVQVSDSDPSANSIDRVNLAVDALDRVCVAYSFKPTADFTQNQIAARVLAFDGTNVSYLTHSFFPFVNYDPDGSLGLSTFGPSVAMTTRQICIAGKGSVNSTNVPAGGPNTASETTFYTVISHPDPQPTPGSQLMITGITTTGPAATITWTGGSAPYAVQKKISLADTQWQDVLTTSSQTALVPLVGGTAYYRVMSGATSNAVLLTAWLAGDREVPPVTTTGSGFGAFTIEGTTLSYDITYSGLSAAASAAHIHAPASSTGTASPIVPFTTLSSTSGRITGTTTLTAAQITNILAGLSYANIHTSANPGGEIRGQLTPAVLHATLTGASEVPAVTTSGTGAATLWLVGDRLAWNVTYSALSTNATAAHLHGPAAAGATANPIVPFPGASGSSGTLTGSVTVTNDAALGYIVDGLTYVNVHTGLHPAGEIRGQVGP